MKPFEDGKTAISYFVKYLYKTSGFCLSFLFYISTAPIHLEKWLKNPIYIMRPPPPKKKNKKQKQNKTKQTLPLHLHY